MHPSSLFSYYPTYAILDEIVSFGHYRNLNIFIDLKNNLQTTYMKHAIINIIESTKRSRFIDTSIFSSLISFLTFHKIYGMKRGLDINFFVFFESGESYYHKNISKTYKISRKIDNLYGLEREDRDLFFNVLQSNFRLIESACNKMPTIKVIRLPNLEADFIPYYLLTRNLISINDRTGNIVYSNDHDLWQCTSNNCYVFSKSMKGKTIIKHGDVMERFLKRKTNISDEYLPLAMAIIGDTGDDVHGVDTIGPSRFLEIFPSLISLTGNMETIYSKIQINKKLFDSVPSSIPNKYLKKVIDSELSENIVSNNLKLVSFELICRNLEDPIKTDMIDKRNIIKKVIENNDFYPPNVLKNVLEKLGIILEDTSIDFMYI